MPTDAPVQDTIRILVATDNHVGYEERDPIRKDDSWKTFDEIMNLARTQDVDMVLLGGDLFHDNKPSRKSMYQVMRSLRKNCLGMKPCELEFLSDAHEVFEGAFPHVNYEDPDMNISIPVFSIHGNHDDPSGDGHFCSLDLLQVAGLVNYFGRVPEVDNIQVKPVLLQKGRTKLALYGLSNVRDERLFRTFRDHHVSFFRPTQQASDFFNLLTVHQNHHAHTATSYLPENVLPDWMNLVIWGHEHECKIDPIKNDETGFDVVQPGSSVATSLIKAEAVQKQVALVSITGQKFTCEPIPLKTVRPFVTDEIVLNKKPEFKKLQNVKNNREQITKLLIKEVDKMIERANHDWLAVQDVPEHEIQDEDWPLPLIRLKVEYSAEEGGNFDVENPQRFSNRFVGKVANINDVVSFYRKKTTTRREKDDPSLPERIMEAIGNDDVVKPDVLVEEFLAQSSLKVLPKNEFIKTLESYVEKGGAHIMDEFVSESLTKSLNAIVKISASDPDADISTLLEAWKEREDQSFVKGGKATSGPKRRMKERPEDYDSDLGAHWGDDPDHWDETTAAAGAPTKKTTRGRNRRSASNDDVEMDDLFVSQGNQDDSIASQASKPAAKRGAAARKAPAKKPAKKAPANAKAPATRGRPKQKSGIIVDSDEDEEEEAEEADAMSEDVFMDEDEEDDPPAPPPPKRAARTTKAATSRTAASRATKAAPATKTRQATLNFSQSQRPAAQRVTQTQKALEISDDEIDDDDDDDDGFEPVAPPTTRSRRR
ncbi:meiotic recombination [Diaporthe australafricana]|uniref:Double-strand break repair protein n=1 Tax=Diaporthe australafricana TaxID=127596 RepID=A0ABR3W5X9_9PEZI